MRLLRGFAWAISVVLCLSLTEIGMKTQAQADSTVTGSSPNPALRPSPPVRAIVTDGESGEVIPDFALTFTTIDVPGAGYTGVLGINKAGVMVGNYGQNVNTDSHGFEYSNGTFTYFDYPDDAGFTVGRGVNDSNLIVGSAGNIQVVGFLYDGTTFTTLHDGADSATFADGIDNAGNVVGGAGTAGATTAFELRNGLFRTINFPGTYVYGFANGINNLGEVAGYTISGLYQYGYTYRNGKFQNVDFPGATQTAVFGINDSGIVVGWYATTSCQCAFASKDGKYISLAYPGAVFTCATGINKSGQIVGQFQLSDNTYHGFVTSPLTPVHFH